jgi:beta-mannosidase
MIDYLGERKAVYYAARRFYAPLLLSLYRNGDTIEAHVVNDVRAPVSGRCSVRACSFDGRTLLEATEAVSIGANAAAEVARLHLQDLDADPCDVFVHASLTTEGAQPDAENVLFLAEPKDLHLTAAEIEVRVGEHDGSPAVTLEAPTFAAYVWLSAPGFGHQQWSDNFFYLLPGRPYTVRLQGVPPEGLGDRVRIRTLAS